MSTPSSRLERFYRSVRTLLIIFGLTGVVGVVAEIGARLWFAVAERLAPPKRNSFTDAYPGADWAMELYREGVLNKQLDWKPYVYFRRRPVHSRYFNIDEHGRRKTWQSPELSHIAHPPKVFLMGGSTMIGVESRDDYTLPSCLARQLAERGIYADVTNFGEGAYVSTQEVLTLLLELRNGNIPDLVIFYDGVNEVYSSFQNGVAGIPQNEVNREREFGLLADDGRRGDLYKAAVVKMVTNSGLYRVAQGIRRKWLLRETQPTLPPETLTRLTRDTVQAYAFNVQLVEAVAEAMGFHALFYWQPLIFTKPQKAGDEAEIAQQQAHVESLYRQVYAAVRQTPALQTNPHFHDLQDLFRETSEPLYVDFCHVTETGNERIARRMLEDVAPLLRERALPQPVSQGDNPSQ